MLDLPRVEQAVDRLPARDARRDEDRENDGQPGDALRAEAPQGEGDSERDRGRRVTEVVDQIGEQGDAAGKRKDDRLCDRRDPENEEGKPDRAQPLARALDRGIDQAVRMTVVVPVDGRTRVVAHWERAASTSRIVAGLTCSW